MLDFLLGTLPNFFGATGLFAVLYIYSPLLGIRHKRAAWVSATTAFAGLTAWEYVQHMMGYPADPYDI